MFEIGWSELAILVVVAVVFVGPGDLPKVLRTVGRYVGSARRQAAIFRSQFDDVMLQARLQALQEEVADIQSLTEHAVREAQQPRTLCDERLGARGNEALQEKALHDPTAIEAASSGIGGKMGSS